MMNIDRQVLGLSLRTWGLGCNFVANILALVGLVEYVQSKEHTLLIVGLVIGLACILVLAMPHQAK